MLNVSEFVDPALVPKVNVRVAAFAHVGNGTNVIYVDPENDLVVVARWIENGSVDGFVGRVLASVGAPAAEGKGGANK